MARRFALILVLLLAVGGVGGALAEGCPHSGGGGQSGCPMSGCPGSGQAMTKVSGTITFIGANHESLKVKKGEKVTVLLVHPRCPNHDQLVAKIAKLKVGRTFVG
jgi:hypothetical protein